MKQHINNVCRQCYFQLRQLQVIRRSLPSAISKTLLHAFVSSRLLCIAYAQSAYDYAILMWNRLSMTHDTEAADWRLRPLFHFEPHSRQLVDT